MGMFDHVEVKNNSFDIPVGIYQTKSLHCNLDMYVIENNLLTLENVPGDRYEYWNTKNIPNKLPCIVAGTEFTMEIYTDSIPGKNWTEYNLFITDGKIIDAGSTYDKEVDFEEINYVPLKKFLPPLRVTDLCNLEENIFTNFSRYGLPMDSFGNEIPIEKFMGNHTVSDEDIKTDGLISKMISELYTGFEPNIIDIRGKHVWFYHGFEYEFMTWDYVDKRKLKKNILKYRREVVKAYLLNKQAILNFTSGKGYVKRPLTWDEYSKKKKERR